MAISVAQMKIDDGLNPHFFAYGQFPLYLAYFSYQIVRFILTFWSPPLITLSLNHSTALVPFRMGVFWLRFWSATASTLTIPIVYLITKEVINRISNLEFGHLVAALVAFTPGLIQAAHFGTTESLLTFFFMVIIYLSIKFLKTERVKWLLFSGIVSGLALGTKISAAFFVFAPIIAILLTAKKKAGSIFKKIVFFSLFSIFYFLLALVFFSLSSPYNFLAFKDFLGTNIYETHVAQGKTSVFYTRQFEGTIPIVYQLTHLFPYALGWPIFVLGLFGFLLICLSLLRYSLSRSKLLVLSFSFLVYFIPNAFLYCKWTRFMTPIIPMFSIFTGFFFSQVYRALKSLSWETQNSISDPAKQGVKLKTAAWRSLTLLSRQNYSLKLKTFNFLVIIFSFLVLAFSLMPGLLFFSIYLKPDTRVEASKWIHQNLPDGSYILSETANVVDIPVEIPKELEPQKSSDLVRKTYKVISFNFYELDKSPSLQEELVDHLSAADYIFVPSQRIFPHVLRLSNRYPLTARYYQLLFANRLGFEKVAHFSRLADESAEETFSVFDHPPIRIYQKVKPFSKEEYQKLF